MINCHFKGFDLKVCSPPNPQSQRDAISAVKALNIANAQGQRIYEITPANQATVLSQINHDSATMDEIRASLTVGKTVITHTDAVSVIGYVGAGYIIFDPETGEGAYKITGGSNGSETYDPTLAKLSGFFAGFGLQLAIGAAFFAFFASLLLFVIALIVVFLALMVRSFTEVYAAMHGRHKDYIIGRATGAAVGTAVTPTAPQKLPKLFKYVVGAFNAFFSLSSNEMP